MLGRFFVFGTPCIKIFICTYRNDQKKPLLNPVGMEKKLRKTWSFGKYFRKQGKLYPST